jgi:hypothetical protein
LGVLYSVSVCPVCYSAGVSSVSVAGASSDISLIFCGVNQHYQNKFDFLKKSVDK